MTEAEWLACEDHLQITFFVAAWMSLRKLRLAEVALCRRVEHHLVDERSRHALKMSEAHADGLVSDEVLTEVRLQAEAAYRSLFSHTNTERDVQVTAALYVWCAVGDESDLRMQVDMIDVAIGAPKPPPDSISPELRAENVANAKLVRDIFGNPFQPVSCSDRWRTDTAVSLARTMYESRDFSAMPILADALQDAGCDDNDILNHCRSDGVHVRGCWVVDLVLSKE